MEIRSFYKAFMTKKDETEVMMKVDTSGDMFSPTPIDAIRELYTAGLQTQDLIGMPLTQLFSTAALDKDGEPVEVAKPDDAEEKYTPFITLLKITPINQEQTDAAIIDGELEGKRSCLVAVKNLTDGYQSAIMEYHMNRASVIQLKDETVWTLTVFDGTRNMETDDPETWPENLHFTLPKKYEKTDKKRDLSVTAF